MVVRERRHSLYRDEGYDRLALDAVDADGKRAPFGGVQSLTPTGAVFSPDGRWVAYATMEAGNTFSTVYVQPFPPTGATYQVSRDDDGHHPVWSRDGKELFYVPGPGRLASTTVTTQPSFAITPPTLLPPAGLQGPPRVLRNYDVMPDAARFVGLTAAGDEDQSEAATGRQLHVVLNWFEELKAKFLDDDASLQEPLAGRASDLEPEIAGGPGAPRTRSRTFRRPR